VAESYARCDEAVACGATAGIPYWTAFSTTYAAGSIIHLRDAARTRGLAAEGFRLAAERGFASLRIKASILLGWCDVLEGRAEQGRGAIQTGLADFLADGERTSATNWQTMLAGAHLACGDLARANQVLDDAFAFVESTGERLLEHELHRLRGECLLAAASNARGGAQAASEHFERAIAIAAARNAILFELRAAVSLLRVRRAAARDRVARLVERFTGDDDCVDARLAREALR
jgi:predicted ATPase